MAKTYPWSEIVPSGSDQASTADDHFRRLRLEIRERMNDIVEDWTADPVVLKASAVSGNKLLIHSSAFVVEPSEDAGVGYGDNNLEVANGANPMRAALQLVPGLVLTQMRAVMTHPGGSGSTILSLKALQFGTPLAITTICQIQTAGDGVQVVDSVDQSPFNHTIAEDEALFLTLDVSAVTGKLHIVELTYDTGA